MSDKHLILGGARSGKSRFAEQRALGLQQELNSDLVYIATATAGDHEMRQRIEEHQRRRDQHWQLIEESINLAHAVAAVPNHSVILIDCLTLWLSNCLHEKCWSEQRIGFLNALRNSTAHVLMVSNDVGSGVVPMGELSRQFVDESGWLHQEIAKQCSRVDLIVAGLPLTLKPSTRES